MGLKLGIQEPDRHDAVPLRGPQETGPGPVLGGVVLERDLVEAGEGRANVRSVVDRQPPLSVRVDVREGAVRQLCPLPCAEPCHHPG
jgi:hypothetical protein